MEDHIKFEIGWKQKARENFTLTTQRLIGIVRNVYGRMKNSGSTICFPVHRIDRMFEDHEMKDEQVEVEAIGFLLRRQLTFK